MEILKSNDIQRVNLCIQKIYSLCTLSDFPEQIMGLLTERDRTVLSLLIPHLKAAYCNAQEYTKVQRQLRVQSRALEQLNTVMLNASGRVQMMSASAVNLLHRYFKEDWTGSRHFLPDALSSWVQAQLRLPYPDIIAPILPFRIEKNGRQLEVQLLCDFDAEQHWLVLSEKSVQLSSPKQLRKLGLSQREAEVLALVAAGKTNAQISEQLFISVKTVKKHLENSFVKLGAQNRVDAVNKAFQ